MSAPWTHSHDCTLSASPERVFAALTVPDELRRWFAEDVEIDAKPGGAYRFWGRHTYGLPDRAAATQRITTIDAPRSLGYSWTIEHTASEVTLSLRPDDKDPSRTKVSVQHTFPTRLAVPYSDELVDDLWRLTLGNLEAHLRGGDGIVLPDFGNPSQEIRLSIVIDAPRSRVFRALVEPQALNRWIATAAEVEPRIGGRYTYAWKYAHAGKQVEGGPTTILDLVENERVVTDWTDWRGDTTRPPTRLAWMLEDAGTGTKVTLVHGGFSRTVDQGDYGFGWWYFLERLKAMNEDAPKPVLG